MSGLFLYMRNLQFCSSYPQLLIVLRMIEKHMGVLH